MVTNITSLTGNGLKDWLIQRVTAAIFAVFTLFIFGFLVFSTPVNYFEWRQLFHQPGMQVFFIASIGAYALHAWIGIWTVTTDYIHCTAIRLSVQLAVLGLLIAQFLTSILIVWGR